MVSKRISGMPPVVDRIYELAKWYLEKTPKFPRSHRFSLGERVETVLFDLVETSVEAARTDWTYRSMACSASRTRLA